MLEKYTKEEILGFIEEGYKNLGDIGSKNAAVALVRGLPGDGVMEVGSVLEFLDGLGIPRDYVPPRMLARRALALMFAFHETIAELEKSVVHYAVDVGILIWFHRRKGINSVADIYQLPDEKVDELLAIAFRSEGYSDTELWHEGGRD